MVPGYWQSRHPLVDDEDTVDGLAGLQWSQCEAIAARRVATASACDADVAAAAVLDAEHRRDATVAAMRQQQLRRALLSESLPPWFTADAAARAAMAVPGGHDLLTDEQVAACVQRARSHHASIASKAARSSNETAVEAALAASLLPRLSQLSTPATAAMGVDMSAAVLTPQQVSDAIDRLRAYLDGATARMTRVDFALAREGVAPLSTLPVTQRWELRLTLNDAQLPTTEELTAAASRVAAQARKEGVVLPMPQAVQPVALDTLPSVPVSDPPPRPAPAAPVYTNYTNYTNYYDDYDDYRDYDRGYRRRYDHGYRRRWRRGYYY